MVKIRKYPFFFILNAFYAYLASCLANQHPQDLCVLYRVFHLNMLLYNNLNLNNCKIWKSNFFCWKLIFLSLRSKNLNAKIKEINVLLNFSQMFNMQTLGYTAHIETVFHFLPNSNKHIKIDGYQGLSYPSLHIIHWRWKRKNVDQAFYIVPEKKITWNQVWRSRGPMHEHAIIISATSDPSAMQSSVQILSCNETPVRWCPILLENKVWFLSVKQKFHQPILQYIKVRFTVDRCSFKKESLIHTLLRYGAEDVHLRRILHMLQHWTRMLSSPYACVVFVDYAS